MRRSNILDIMTAGPWYMHPDMYNRVSDMVIAHITGNKDAWRAESISLLEDEDGRSEDDEDYETDSGDFVVSVRGVLAPHSDQVNGMCSPRGRSYESILEKIDYAERSDQCSRLVFRLETPGGYASGCQEVYDAIRSCGKETVAFVDGYCYSAGYYIAAACDTVIASSRSAGLGSIGTIMSTFDDSEMYEKEGVRAVVVRAGEFKALGQAHGEKMDDKAISEMQREVDMYGAAFHDAVRAGRGLTDEQAELTLNGRIFMGQEAIEMGLLDKIASLKEVLNGSKPFAGNSADEDRATGAKERDAMTSIDKKRLHELCQAHADHKDTVIAMFAEDASEAEILAAVKEAGRESELQAAAARAEAAEAAVETAKGELEAAQAKVAELEASVAELSAKAEKLEAFSETGEDPGEGGDGRRTVKRSDLRAADSKTWAGISDGSIKITEDG